MSQGQNDGWRLVSIIVGVLLVAVGVGVLFTLYREIASGNYNVDPFLGGGALGGIAANGLALILWGTRK